VLEAWSTETPAHATQILSTIMDTVTNVITHVPHVLQKAVMLVSPVLMEHQEFSLEMNPTSQKVLAFVIPV